MPHFTVELCYASYYERTETVQAKTLTAALDKAALAADENDHWSSSDWGGPTFVTAAAKGKDLDLYRSRVRKQSIPSRFSERGEGPRIIVTVSGGVVQHVEIKHGTARVEIRDYDTEGADASDPHIRTDDKGDRYALAEWSNVIPLEKAE